MSEEINTKSHLHPKIWVPILVVAALVVGYLAYANANSLWPYQSQNQESGIKNQGKRDATADWKTYTNSQYGFEVKYPANFIVKDVSQNSLMIDGPKDCDKEQPDIGYCFDDFIFLEIVNNPQKLSPKEWLAKNGGWWVEEGTDIIAGQETLVTYPKDTEDFGKKYIFTNMSKDYTFELTVYSGLESHLADQILSTFKFTE